MEVTGHRGGTEGSQGHLRRCWFLSCRGPELPPGARTALSSRTPVSPSPPSPTLAAGATDMARHCGFNEGRSARHSSLEGGGRGSVAVNPPLRLRGRHSGWRQRQGRAGLGVQRGARAGARRGPEPAWRAACGDREAAAVSPADRVPLAGPWLPRAQAAPGLLSPQGRPGGLGPSWPPPHGPPSCPLSSHLGFAASRPGLSRPPSLWRESTRRAPALAPAHPTLPQRARLCHSVRFPQQCPRRGCWTPRAGPGVQDTLQGTPEVLK